MNIIKYGIGIDISKSTFTASICTLQDDYSLRFGDSCEFDNEKKGFNQFLKWVKKQTIKGIEAFYIMEATGVYYEHLAYHLYYLKKPLHVALPSNTKHYFKSLNVKSKTDNIDSKILSQFACERKHNPWNPPKDIYLRLRAITRYLEQLKSQKTLINNRIHSKEHSYAVPKEIIKQEYRLLKELEKSISICEKQIEVLVQSDDELSLKVDKLSSIKGVGFTTVTIIVAETLGFEYFYNKKQVTSYAGFDVVYRDSGSSLNGKTRISKKGNSHIRRALYFPSLVAARHNKEMKIFYDRVVKKRNIKKIGSVAVARKLLELMYILWKTDQYYIEDYNQQKTASKKSEAVLDIF
ncbi:MAG: IS110 family transposase [Flavobacteriaceae bacterium]|nr:MAG: IS110 family transposase [Flavobacteriaceae bacterium]